MTIIYTSIKNNKKQNKKPGWKKRQDEYNQWLYKINSMTCFDKKISKPKNVVTIKQEKIVINNKSLPFESGSCGKPIHNIYVQYKDNPEMLKRELKAREQKFTVAPLYNKGGNMLITDELFKDILTGATRRRN